MLRGVGSGAKKRGVALTINGDRLDNNAA